jgi:hypothetical protein
MEPFAGFHPKSFPGAILRCGLAVANYGDGGFRFGAMVDSEVHDFCLNGASTASEFSTSWEKCGGKPTFPPSFPVSCGIPGKHHM